MRHYAYFDYRPAQGAKYSQKHTRIMLRLNAREEQCISVTIKIIQSAFLLSGSLHQHDQILRLFWEGLY